MAEENKTELDHSMSDDEENTSFLDDISVRQRELGTQYNTTAESSAAASTGSSSARSNNSLEMKRSAVKHLIERYFYQLQRGCGNPKCSNVNCASSGKMAPMTPNEIAAKAIQLFLHDDKLCEPYNQLQKVSRTGTQHESPTSSSRSVINDTPLDITETIESYSTRDHNSGSCSTPNSTITSGSSTSSNSTASSNSCATGEMPLLVALGTVDSASGTKEATTGVSTSIPKVQTSDLPTNTLAPIEFLNEQIIDELIEECKKNKNYDCLINAINDVYCSVKKLSKSFRQPPLAKLTSIANASKLHEILGKSPKDLKKEDLRTLEGEHDKDEDSTCLDDDDYDDDSVEERENDTFNEDHGTSSQLGAIRETPTDTSVITNRTIVTRAEPMDEDVNSDDYDNDIVSTQDSNLEWSHTYDTHVDFESLRRVKKKLYGLKKRVVTQALKENIILLAESILSYGRFCDWEKVLHCFVICFDMSLAFSKRFIDFEYMEMTMPKICQAAYVLPVKFQAKLARIWATHCKDHLHAFIQSLQQLITLQVIMDEDTAQENPDVAAITKVLKIVFYANILAGEIDAYNSTSGGKQADSSADAPSSSSVAGSMFSNDDDDIFHYNQILMPYHKTFAEDKLEKELNISCMDCRVPLVPFEEFYNEPLSDAIQMDRDYLSYKNLSLDPLGEENHFSFMLYSFILTPATKVIALYYDSRIRMYSERNSSIYSFLNYFGDGNDAVAQPNLKLKVRRDNIVNDALIGLELVAMSNPKDLKKQLVVEFVGEQGIDEGGVSKEFFQLIVEEIFNPDFGMFTHQEETNTMWFNSTPFENEAQFTLIGIIIGLAIYNNIILAVNFPMVVYRKLMGGRGSFYDLKDWNPTLYKSLKSMLDHEDPDMEEVFMQTFKISYKNVFDEVVHHELKIGGGEIVVNQENKQEFVDLYSNFLLNENIERQFNAFKRGFEMVTDESPLKLLFRPEEVELLVCGSRKFDFMELETSTEYEGGYTIETPIIKDFWSIVHNLPEESKRKLLEFTTGSDRVPVGGLSRLKLLITRHGPDSDRLPTSHTCFNVLLLPEYSSKEKLEERLLKAINYSKGFGML